MLCSLVEANLEWEDAARSVPRASAGRGTVAVGMDSHSVGDVTTKRKKDRVVPSLEVARPNHKEVVGMRARTSSRAAKE